MKKDIGLFARASWNDGHNETWVFTEIDRSASIGLYIDGANWKRQNDQCGIGTVINGLSSYHRDYLAAGGYGFIIGDGQLNYGWSGQQKFFIALIYFPIRFTLHLIFSL
ncbi:MAG: carbohydrate porin [Flammeovirgaceae bacterium]|nr:carbohydrate porin [Flammeovirgaceae bacterium]